MASDAFTNANGTLLDDHAAGGNTWEHIVGGEMRSAIQSNMASLAPSQFGFEARAANSSAGYSQIVLKAGAYDIESKSVFVRSSGADLGYRLVLLDLTGNTFATIALYKNDIFLDAATVAMDRTVDNTLAIEATTAGADQELRGWLNGTPLDWNDVQSEVFVDSTAPIAAGSPGFACGFFDPMNEVDCRFDDWTDTAGAAGLQITAISDDTLTHAQAGVVISLTGYQAAGKTVKICPSDDVDDAAGVLQTVTAQDANSITITTILNTFSFGVTLYVFVIDNGGTESNADGEPVSRVAASATLQFTGAAKFFDEAGSAQANATLTFYVWRAPRPPGSGGAPDQIITNQTTSAQGELSMPITVGALTPGNTVYAMAFAADGTDLFWCGEALPVYA